MQFLTIIALFGATIALSMAKPAIEQQVAVTQDTAGNYELSFNIDDHSRTETGSSDGSVRGSYRYVDGDGVLQTVQYTAGVEGFQASGTNLPVPINDTPEVAQAKAAHLANF